MKKFMLIVMILLLSAPSAFCANSDGRTDKGVLGRIGIVEKRGFLNAFGLPLEIGRTFSLEREIHSRLWPVTAVPRTFTHMMIRTASAVTDIFFFPWVTPFTNNLTPLTKPMGLSDYPWQKE